MISIIPDDFKEGIYITIHYKDKGRNFTVYKILSERNKRIWKACSYSSVSNKFHRIPVADFSGDGDSRRMYKSQINEIFKLETSKVFVLPSGAVYVVVYVISKASESNTTLIVSMVAFIV